VGGVVVAGQLNIESGGDGLVGLEGVLQVRLEVEPLPDPPDLRVIKLGILKRCVRAPSLWGRVD
jgi:hypothetical protein